MGDACGGVAVTAGVAGTLDTTSGALTGGAELRGGDEPAGAETPAGDVDLLAGLVPARPPAPGRVCSGRVVTGGASRLPAETGSEERPMCWLVSWPVAHVMPAVSAMPSSAASAQR